MSGKGKRCLNRLLTSGGPMKPNDLVAALEEAGCEVSKTANGHFLVRRAGVRGSVTIATQGGEFQMKYLSRVKNTLQLGEEVVE